MEPIGSSPAKIDARAKVTGRAAYAGDRSLPGMLHLKPVLSDRAHARVVAVDVRPALALPGVAVLTGRDAPFNFTGVERPDKPVLCDERVRCVGDIVALAAAETPEAAAAAAALIRVTYEDLPVITDPLAAQLESAVAIHADCPDNIAHSFKVRRGDLQAGFLRSDVICARTYATPMQEHAFLEPEAGLAYIDEDGRVVVICAGQDAHEDRRQIARMLALPEDQVRVIYGPIGGAFGGREDVAIQPLLALAAWRLRRPVKMVWSRVESILGHPKRHAMIFNYRWGAARDGRILAAQCDITSDAGAYLSTSASVLDNYRFAAIGPYSIPNVWVDARTVYTNHPTGGAFRGFGAPQATFAAELQIEHLAEMLNIDPLELRRINSPDGAVVLPTGSPLTGGSSLGPLLDACAGRAAALRAEKNDPPASRPGSVRRGIGLAAGMKNSGFSFGYPETSSARVTLFGDAVPERAEVVSASADVGQGVRTVLAQVAARELQLPMERITVSESDSAAIGPAGPASASRLTMFAGSAVVEAARRALDAWRDENRPAVGEAVYRAPETIPADPDTGRTPYHSVSFTLGVDLVEVEVDLETGMVRLVKVIAAHDPGRVIHPRMLEGQVQGGIVQAQGWSLLEDFVCQDGRVLSDRLSTYLIPTALDTPERIESLWVEAPDPVGPYGARGMGEVPFVPLAPAIVAAIHDAIGVWFDHIPVRPQEVLQALRGHSRR